MKYAVIMAGGTGKRLWPLSRRKRPKQVLKLFDGETLLRRCFDRLTPIFDADKIIVLTNAAYVDVVCENLPELPGENVIAEPAVRDTAGAIGLVSAVLSKLDPDATMAVVTADQIIEPVEVLQEALKDALEFAEANQQALVTFGIKPTFPSTMLGYIKCINPESIPGCTNDVYKVERFAEKPDEATATEYVSSGQYFWNSGMFVWKAQTMLANLQEFLPDATEPLAKIRDAWGAESQQSVLEEWFVKLPRISIDYAVMEKSQEVHAIELDCRWLDLGAFTALAEIMGADGSKNVVAADTTELLDCAGSIVVTEDKGHLVAAIGVENLVIAHSPDATLICPADKTERLKELIDLIEKHGGERFL